MPRTPLLHPDEYFRERAPGLDFGYALVLAVVVALLTTAAVGFVGWQFSEALDTTITVENENRPPDWVCEDNGDDWPGCDEPETRELNLGDELWDRFVGLLPVVFFSSLLGWLVVGVFLHLLSRGGGRGTFGDTLAVAAWGGVPMFVESAVGLVAASRVVRGTSFSQNPEVLLQQLQELQSFLDWPLTFAVGLVVAGWQLFVWRAGLEHARGLDSDAALGVAGLVAFVVFLLGVVG
ncbi:Yip1 family protein [Haloprofundus sp. MHR1]|uniref:Yip1 family protein n=1 Tax=Haloprofundus sp. MHR1 TaxID=2572921 RepID=UPI0010BF2405|nr:Yip1 family protein [Haloprofundus sp. MHR1]QCJ47471.1 YIP1 family protein [Haloprofundus sp. MHR1]